MGDLDPGLIDRFRAMWRKKSGNEGLDGLAAPLLLNDAELMTDGMVTIAALVLLGGAVFAFTGTVTITLMKA